MEERVWTEELDAPEQLRARELIGVRELLGVPEHFGALALTHEQGQLDGLELTDEPELTDAPQLIDALELLPAVPSAMRWLHAYCSAHGERGATRFHARQEPSESSWADASPSDAWLRVHALLTNGLPVHACSVQPLSQLLDGRVVSASLFPSERAGRRERPHFDFPGSPPCCYVPLWSRQIGSQRAVQHFPPQKFSRQVA